MLFHRRVETDTDIAAYFLSYCASVQRFQRLESLQTMSSSSSKLRLPLAILAAGLATFGHALGDTIAWNFGVSGSPSASPSTTAANVTSSALSRGNNKPDPGTNTLINATSGSTTYSGASGANNAGVAARSGALSTASAGSGYFEFTLTPDAGYQVKLDAISFGTRSTNTGPASYTLRSSLDSYASDITTGSITVSGNPWALKTNSGLTPVSSSAITFRLYGYGGTGSPADNTTNWRIDDLSLTVTVSASSSDTTPPTLATTSPLSPADDATSVAIGTSLSATFSESIAAGTGNITLYKASDNSVVQNFAVGTSAVTIAGATATFTPSSPLLNNTDYYVLIPSGVIVDGASNPFAGITSATAWNFKTIPADITPPTIVSVTPATASTNLAPPTSLAITFSENIQIASSGSPKVYIKRVSDDVTVAEAESSVFGTVSVTNNIATVPVSPALDYGVAYYVTIDAGAFEDVSTSNNPFAGLSKYSDPPTNSVLSWTFTTINVPGLTTTYTQNFSSFNSMATLPLGWSVSGGAGFASGYIGDWGTTPPAATPGGFTGNAGVFGYQHNSLTQTGTNPLLQTLTLRNTTGATITDLSVSYKGRVTVTTNTRIPSYGVSVAGNAQTALAYSTADGDNEQRNASISGLSISDGATFQISWSSLYPTGAGSARQIGISDVSISVGPTSFAPTVANMSVPTATIGGTLAVPQADVIGDGGQTLSARGFVYSITSVEPNPTLGTSGTTTVTNASSTTGSFSESLSGLSPSTTYSIRAYATNPTGTAYSQVITFSTLAPPPNLVSSYSQEFSGFNSSLTLPAGWSALSSLGIQSYASAWTSTSSTGGFSGAETSPGVLGYRHTSSTGVLTVTLRMINNTGTTLNSLYVKYLGRTFDTTQTRSPAWTVAVNGVAAPDLLYSTESADLSLRSKVVTGLSIAPGSEFSITWTCDRGLNASGSSKKIGISSVVVAVPTAPVVGTASASSVTSTTATLNGSVTADGYYPITARGFVYAPTSTNADPVIGGPGVTDVIEGGTTVSGYTSPLTGLTASTGYSLKAYATNSLGTTYSSVATFTTSAPGLSYDTWNDTIGDQAANLDYDGDGISNGVEFFMGTPGNAFTVNPGIVGGTVTWPRATGTLITSFKVEVSTNLSSWTDASVTYPGSVSAPSGGPVTFTLPSGPTILFVRLSVTP